MFTGLLNLSQKSRELEAQRIKPNNSDRDVPRRNPQMKQLATLVNRSAFIVSYELMSPVDKINMPPASYMDTSEK